MTRLELVQLSAILTPLIFVIAVGACVGSLTNVLVYRLPLGLGVVTPSSSCPSCRTNLTWRENIPIFGWLLLRGRCRFCRTKISPEYPLVEAFVAVLFGVFYALWYMVPDSAVWLGIPVGAVKPEWAQNGLAETWPVFIVLMTLVSSLVAMTLVDAKTFMIPLVLAWVPAIVALIVHPVWAAWIDHKGGWLFTQDGHVWAMASHLTQRWTVVAASVGGVLGLGVGLVLLKTGLIRRSFADYEEWEAKAIAEAEAQKARKSSESGDDSDGQEPTQLWIMYPHARREMIKELAFLAPCVLMGLGAARLAPALFGPEPPPLWVTVLGSVLLGYLIGGGVIWGARLLGSLAFGKEAMGLGDVHLLAAVGACVGWIDAVLAFFGACFVGLFLEMARRPFASKFRQAMPFGPSLAIAAVLVVLLKPVVELGLSRLTGSELGLP